MYLPVPEIVTLLNKMKFSIEDFFSECDQIHRKLRMVTFTKEIYNGKLHMCSGFFKDWKIFD